MRHKYIPFDNQELTEHPKIVFPDYMDGSSVDVAVDDGNSVELLVSGMIREDARMLDGKDSAVQLLLEVDGSSIPVGEVMPKHQASEYRSYFSKVIASLIRRGRNAV